ncbi:MAG TPA: autotransporter-associated beta strand repeat-containing protein, partial [Verrucomicrobiae bacterium]|nr:autotransporter-associated beta strand repeat-containing protein [Verrucomicrobiae bacterium]
DNFSGGIFVHGGTLVLDDANSALAGGLTNDSGTIVQLGNNDANGNMPLGTVQINGSLVFNLTNSRTISTAITGSGTVTQSGSNTLTLTGANTYTGNTTVTQGTLALSGAVTINSSPLIAVQNSTLDVSRAESGSLTSVTLTNGNLNVGLGTNSTTMNSLSLSNSTVTLIADYNNIGGSPIMGAGNLSTGGTTNMLNVTAIRNLPITASLPFDLPLMSYSSATFNSGFNLGWTNLTGISGYISNNTIASTIDLIITNAPQTLTWNGGSLTDNNWNDPANWSGSTLQPLDAMTFDGLLRTNNINNTPAGTTYAGITFNNSQGPAPFTLGGAPINLVGTMINNASIVQTVNLGQLVSANYTNDGGGNGGSLTINGGFTNISGSTETVTLLNTGTLVDLWATNNGAQGGGQLEFQLGAGGGDWVIMDGTGTNGLVQAGNVQLNMAGGTLEFGSSNSSPNVDAGFTNAASAVTVNGAPGTFNMNSGTLKVYGMNMANSGTANANFNMNGGTLIIGSNSFSGGGGNGGSVLTAVITNGSIYSTNGGTFTLAQRSPSTLTMGGGLLRIGALSLSSGTAATGTGTVNLNGGTFNCTNVSVGSSAANGWGTIFYNGGTFQIGASVSALFKQNNLVPLTNAVQAGGAVIDSAGTSSTFNWPLISDPALGGAPDGGLVKIGAGTVTLSAGNSYIGNTTISAGTLAVSGSLSNGTVTVAAAGTLAGSGTVGGSVIVNGTIAPGSTNTIGTLTVTTNVTLSGITLMKLNAATVTSDNLAAPGAGQGSIALGGALVVSNISASPLAAGQTFTLFTTPSLSGSFTSIQPATPGAGLAWNTNNLGVNGTLSVVSSGGGPTTNATITHVSLSGTNLLVHGTNNNVPNTSFHYVVLSATNVATPLSNWVPVVTNSFNPDGTFDYTNPVVPGTPRQFIDVKAVP